MWKVVVAIVLFLAGCVSIGLNLFVFSGSLAVSFAAMLPMVLAVILLLGSASL